MSEPNEENLGLDWLDKLVAQFKSEPIFEGPQWNQILAELGRITVFFDVLNFNLKGQLITLEKPEDLTMDTSSYARLRLSDIIKKCRKALNNLEPSFTGKRRELFKDCREQLIQCHKLRKKRNELIHALWSPSAFPPHTATRLQTIERLFRRCARARALGAPDINTLDCAVYSCDCLATQSRVCFNDLPLVRLECVSSPNQSAHDGNSAASPSVDTRDPGSQRARS